MNENRYAKIFIAGFMLIALVAVFRWVLLWRVQYSYMDGEYPYWMQQKDYINKKDGHQEIIFLGDSRMKAGVVPLQLCSNAYNLAVGGGTTVEMYYSLCHYLKKHPHPQMVIMGFGPFHYELEDCFKSRTHYFHFLPLWEELQAQFIGYQQNHLSLMQLRKEIVDTLAYHLLFPQKYSAACINSKFSRADFNYGIYHGNAARKGQMFFGMADECANLNTEAHKISFAVYPRIDYYMRKIIALCQKNNIPLYIEQLPMNEQSLNTISANGYYAAFQAYLMELADTGVAIEFDIPCYNATYFGDPSHLNVRGAEKFTAEIKAKYHL